MGPYDEAAEIIGINRRAVDRLVNKRILPLASVGTKAFLEAAADYAAGADIRSVMQLRKVLLIIGAVLAVVRYSLRLPLSV